MKIAIITVALLFLSTVVVADEVTAQREAVLRKNKSTISPVVTEVPKGQKLPVIRREEKWIMSESGGQQGWAHESWLKDDRGNFIKGLSEAGVTVSGSAQASAATDAAAAKGLGPMARKFVATKGLRSTQLEDLMKLRAEVIENGEWEAFAREGKVGPAELRR